MASLARTEAYFSGVAARYQASSTGRLWRRVREREARSVGDLLGDITGHEVLELGCGAGFYTRLLLACGARHVTAVDLSQAMLDELPQTAVTPVRADATTLRLERKFDRILTAGMLEFVPDAGAALAAAAAHGNAAATLVILYPVDSLLGRGYRRFHRKNGLDIRLFRSTEIRRLADNSGWSLETTRSAGPYSNCARLRRQASS